jgi:hypothetical protein
VSTQHILQEVTKINSKTSIPMHMYGWEQLKPPYLEEKNAQLPNQLDKTVHERISSKNLTQENVSTCTRPKPQAHTQGAFHYLEWGGGKVGEEFRGSLLPNESENPKVIGLE